MPNTAAQEDQERATLEGLELDCRSSMISLEQAEKQYEEHLLQASEDHLPVADPSLDITTESNAVISDQASSGTSTQQETILDLARVEVDSMRNSITRTSIAQYTPQDHVIRHSQRLSKLMQEDHPRLSQRWSTLLTANLGSAEEPWSCEGGLSSAVRANHKRSLPDLPKLTTLLGRDNIYTRFLTWFVRQIPSSQVEILDDLRSNLHPSSLPAGHVKAIDIRVEQPLLIEADVSQSDQTDTAGPHIPMIVICLKNENIGDLSSETVQVWVRDKIELLDLSWNSIESIPKNMGDCTHLRRLDLRHNQLETIPEALLCLSSLVALDLRDNKLRYIPSAISKMTELQVLLLSDNNIQGIPLAIGRMKNLKLLEVVRNPVVFPSTRALIDVRHPQLEEVAQDKPVPRTVYTECLKAYLKFCPAKEITITNGMIPYTSTRLHVFCFV
jgi:Leucine-rich repeat (LRR) protein